MRKFLFASGTVLSAALFYENYTESYVFTRNLRTIRCGINILYSYKISFNEDNYLHIHDRIAEDIYNTCIQNDGLYVKFGQGIAAMDHLLPPPFYKHMSKLQDKAKSAPYAKIAKLFKDEVGTSIEDTFSTFDKEPVASASLAQVHKATLKDGTSVAVKIQKPNIKGQFSSDMVMHYLINFVLEKAFELPLLHFVEDVQKNLRKELDFRIEASNSELSEKNFKLLNRNQLHVPKVYQQYTRERVMVSEWIDGIKITEENQLKKLGFNKKSIMTDLIRAFADQIFVTGFIHCDPHPGNVLVRPHPQNKKTYQIVILDHGLCLPVSDDFRKKYAVFWKSMFLQDTDKMKEVCRGWGMKFSDEFAGAQLLRPYSSNKMLTEKIEKKDVIKLQMQMKQKLKQMMKETQNFPKELLFIGRNMNLVRSLNKHYGGIADRITIMAKSAYVGSHTQTHAKPKTGIWYKSSEIGFHLRVYLLQFSNWVLKNFSGKFVDDFIENEQVKNSQKMFEKYGFKALDEKAYNA